MANANQSANRSGNPVGRQIDGTAKDAMSFALKPGYVVKVRDRFLLIEAVEGFMTDLFFNDSFTFTMSSATAINTSATDDSKLLNQYGARSVIAMSGKTSAAQHTVRMNMAKPSFDSGYIEFKDLEPNRGHMYHLVPSLPSQPKYIDKSTGDWLVNYAAAATTLPSEGGTPVGFLSASTANLGAHLEKAGNVSAKCYLKHPAGNPKWVLDSAPEGASGTVKGSGSIEGISGFVDGHMSPIEDPDWSFSIWVESGENNLPQFAYVNDSEEMLIDARLRLSGFKYRVVELSMDQLKQIRDRSGGRLTFTIINPAGIPTPGTLLADYFPR